MSATFPSVGIYHAALLNYLLCNDEAGLMHAYELGRLGLNAGCGLLHLLEVHEQALGIILDATRYDHDIRMRVNASARFLHEALSPFGMATAGYRDLLKTP